MKDKKQYLYPGASVVMNGAYAVCRLETQLSDVFATDPIIFPALNEKLRSQEYPIAFSKTEGSGREISFAAGLAMTGLRVTSFCSGQGIFANLHALSSAAGKRLPFVVHLASRSLMKGGSTNDAGHDDYHGISESGCFQFFAKNVQEVVDLSLIARRVSELSLTPSVVAQDCFLTTDLRESLLFPESDLVSEYLGQASDIIDTPTASQQMLFGPDRRRIPELWNVDNPMMLGAVLDKNCFAKSIAAQNAFFLRHDIEVLDESLELYSSLTGRPYQRIGCYLVDDADYLLVAQGSAIGTAEAAADYFRKARGIKVGVVNIRMLRPFPGDLISRVLKNRQAVTVLERVDRPASQDRPLSQELRAVIQKCHENSYARHDRLPHPDYDIFQPGKNEPCLFSASYGMGGSVLKSEDVVGAVENMLADGERKKSFYLSLDFLPQNLEVPKRKVIHQSLRHLYPELEYLTVKGSESPSLLPKDSITVRVCVGRKGGEQSSAQGQGEVFLGGLTDTLIAVFSDIFEYQVQATQAEQSHIEGAPLQHEITVAPHPIKLNYGMPKADVLIVRDVSECKRLKLLQEVKDGGIFIFSSDLDSPANVWASLPSKWQELIAQHNIRVFYIDGQRIVKEETADSPSQSEEVTVRLLESVLKGTFFALTVLLKKAKLSERDFIRKLKKHWQRTAHKSTTADIEVYARVMRRGFSEFVEIKAKHIISETKIDRDPTYPLRLKNWSKNPLPLANLHRFWEDTACYYEGDQKHNIIADPFIATGVIPRASGILRDLSLWRAEHPVWVPEKCIGCGACWTLCPDSAIPGLLSEISAVFETTICCLEENGYQIEHLRKAKRILETKLRAIIKDRPVKSSFAELLKEAIAQTIAGSEFMGLNKTELEREFSLFEEQMKEFPLALTKKFYTGKEKKEEGSGALLSVTIDPYHCKGCMLCIKECPCDALVPEMQSDDSVATLRKTWNYWLKLPNSPSRYTQTLDTLLLDKNVYHSMVGGDSGPAGSAEKTVQHLFASVVNSVMQKRVAGLVQEIDQLIEDLEKHIRLKLSVDLSDVGLVRETLDAFKDRDISVSDFSERLDLKREPVDADWLRNVVGLLQKLRDIKTAYTTTAHHQGRASMGCVSSSDTDTRENIYPYNPYPFPWVADIMSKAPGIATGVFEGHMMKMADCIKTIRIAKLELDEEYRPEKHDAFFAQFSWRDFSYDEYLLCPPVVLVGKDKALYGHAMQDLFHLLRARRPIKVLVLDTQTDPYALNVMISGRIYVSQSSMANTRHMLKTFEDGLNARRPALCHVFCSSLKEDRAVEQARLARTTGTYPHFQYVPRKGSPIKDCLKLESNPATSGKPLVKALEYLDKNGKEAVVEYPLTVADFAATEDRFKHSFRKLTSENWSETGGRKLVHVSEYLDMDSSEREDVVPFIAEVDASRHLSKFVVSREIIAFCEERRKYWNMIESLALADSVVVDKNEIIENTRTEMLDQFTQSLVEFSMAKD